MLNSEREECVNMELRAACERSGKTQAQVAKEAAVTDRMYQDYEYNKSEPGVRTAIRIAKALNSRGGNPGHRKRAGRQSGKMSTYKE